MWVLDKVLFQKLAQNEKSVLAFAGQPWSRLFYGLSDSNLVGHVEEQDICADPVLPLVLSAQSVKDDSKFDFMVDIFGATVPRDCKRRSLLKKARRRGYVWLTTYQENGLANIQGNLGRVSLTASAFSPFRAYVKKFFATPKHLG